MKKIFLTRISRLSFLIFFLILFIFLPQSFAALYINEALPNPSGDDNAKKPGGEWVELFNSGEEVDVLGWVLYDAEDTHELVITQDNTSGGAVVPTNGWLVIYRNGDSDFSLNNTGDETVRLFNKEIGADLAPPISTFSYSSSKEARSWGRVPDVSDSIQQLDPSPGSANMAQLPTPTLLPTPTKIPTPTKTTPAKSPTKILVTPNPTQKISSSIPSAGQILSAVTNSKINIPTSVLGQSTKSAVATPSAGDTNSNKEVKALGSNQNNIFKILIGVGGIFIITCAILLFQHFKNKKINN